MKSSDYNKVRGVIVENCNKVSLHSKVTITKLYWTALEIPTYHVTYTYSDKTNDDQKVVLEKKAIRKEIVKEAKKMIIIVRCLIQVGMRSRIIQNNY